MSLIINGIVSKKVMMDQKEDVVEKVERVELEEITEHIISTR